MSARWQRFWFEPESTATLAVLRIVVGVIVLGWTVSLAPDLDAFFGGSGLLAHDPGGAGTWGVLAIFHSGLAVQILYGVLLLASLALIAGYHSRLASLLVFVGVLSFERRNPYVFNTGDGLIKLLCFYLVLAPSGAALSVDRWRSARAQFWEFPHRAPWALRLMQIQLSILYLAGLWVKLQGTTWNDGTAVSYSMRISDLHRFALPTLMTHSPLLANLMTYGTLVIELSIPLLVWNRRWRPYALLAGVCLHLGIEYSIRVGFFSWAMLTLYVSFVDPRWAEVRLRWLRERWAERHVPATEQSLASAA